MTVVVVCLTGGVLGSGVVLVLLGASGRPVLGGRRLPSSHRSPGAGADRWALRFAMGMSVVIVVAWITRWPLVAVATGALAVWLSVTRSGRDRHARELDTVDAIAMWTEQLRDTMSAAHGLQQAIGATAALAPHTIAIHVSRLTSRMEFQQFEDGLREFARNVDHPTADFVVTAILTAHRHQARDVAALLGHLADCARDEAAMRRRIWVGRARSRSAVRIIAGVVVVFVAVLAVFDREYLAPYHTLTGQLVLIVVIGLFTASFIAMDRMGRISMPERFIVHHPAVTM